MKLVLLKTIAVVLLCISCIGCSEKHPQQSFNEVIADKNDFVVEDGDTVLLRGTEVRLLGIDAPEKPSAFFVGDQEPYAMKATDFLRNTIVDSKQVTVMYCQKDDIWGRRLAYIFVDGSNINAKLVESGLAYETVSFYGHSGFPEYAQQVLTASKKWKTLPFEKPYIFRLRGGNREN